MARPLRIEVEGGWYHVISRGIERREIFRDDSDRRDFLGRLFGLTESHGLLVHGYCLMDNHFHLQVQTPTGNLKTAMQRLLSGYVVRFNLRHRRSGPLFQGRYRAILMGEEQWIAELSRYIHLNPVRTQALHLGKQRQAELRRGIADPVPRGLVQERLKALREYRWSSYRALAGYEKGRRELRRSEVLNCFAGDGEAAQRAKFRRFVEEPVREGIEEDDFLSRVSHGLLLGGQEWTSRKVALLKGDQRETPSLRLLKRGSVTIEQIVKLVEKEFGEDWEEMLARHGHPARDLVITLCRGNTAMSLKEIGGRCGGMNYAAVSQACKRMRKRIEVDSQLREKSQRLENGLRCLK